MRFGLPSIAEVYHACPLSPLLIDVPPSQHLCACRKYSTTGHRGVHKSLCGTFMPCLCAGNGILALCFAGVVWCGIRLPAFAGLGDLRRPLFFPLHPVHNRTAVSVHSCTVVVATLGNILCHIDSCLHVCRVEDYWVGYKFFCFAFYSHSLQHESEFWQCKLGAWCS